MNYIILDTTPNEVLYSELNVLISIFFNMHCLVRIHV